MGVGAENSTTAISRLWNDTRTIAGAEVAAPERETSVASF